MVTPEELVSTGEAARILGVSDETVRRWADERLIRHVRLPSGQLRFNRADLLEALKVVEPNEAVS